METPHTSSTDSGAYLLDGNLGKEDVRELFERCAKLRFTGLLELREGSRHVAVTFVGGEPVDGPDPFKLGAVWRKGDYRLAQRSVDLSGGLAEGVAIEGTLAEASPMDLLGLCEDARLSAVRQGGDGSR